MQKAAEINSQEEYLSALERELLNRPNSEGFRYSQITKPSGETIAFRSVSDLRAEINLARAELVRSNILSGGHSMYIGEIAP